MNASAPSTSPLLPATPPCPLSPILMKPHLAFKTQLRYHFPVGPSCVLPAGWAPALFCVPYSFALPRQHFPIVYLIPQYLCTWPTTYPIRHLSGSSWQEICVSHRKLSSQQSEFNKADGSCPTFALFILLDVLVWDMLLSFSWKMFPSQQPTKELEDPTDIGYITKIKSQWSLTYRSVCFLKTKWWPRINSFWWVYPLKF